jgi:GNAT superfamily N-acetyltransferase
VTAQVRQAVPADAKAIGRIKRDGWRAAYRGMIADDVLAGLDAELLAADFERGIRELDGPSTPTRSFLVAESVEGVVGYVILGRYRWDDLPACGEIYALYVSPDRWLGGAGRALLAAAEERLVSFGYGEAALWVLEENRAGRAFYEAVGWRADGVTGERCEVEGAKEVRYRRLLTPPPASPGAG